MFGGKHFFKAHRACKARDPIECKSQVIHAMWLERTRYYATEYFQQDIIRLYHTLLNGIPKMPFLSSRHCANKKDS